MKKRFIKDLFQINTLYDWESEDFITKSQKILEESLKYGLYEEDVTNNRNYSVLIEAWIEKWKVK